jgi:hypothetical protein
MRKERNQRGRQASQQQDNRPQSQRGRDLQRNKMSDKGQGGAGKQMGGDKRDHEGRQQGQQNVYGEGNYAASREYNEATRDFAQSGRVEEAARNAEPRSDADALQMGAAEAEGKRRAKGEDPALNRKSSALSPDTPRAPKPGEEE